jgi:FixJ family two-component response regulator
MRDICASEQLPRQTIYVVDDDPSVRNALVRFLSLREMEVSGFGAAEEFLAELPRLPPGALIVDMQLPGMSGLALLSQMAQAGIHWPAVVISGSHEGHEEEVVLELGPDRYLRKPFEVDALLRALLSAGFAP